MKEKRKKLSRKEISLPLQQCELNDAKIRANKRKKWLNDEEINAGMFLMKQQFPEIGEMTQYLALTPIPLKLAKNRFLKSYMTE